MARAQQTRAVGTNKPTPQRRHPKATDHRLTPSEIVDRLRHSESAIVRNNAIRLLGKYLRRGDRFQATWDALGGAPGTAALMAELSVADVRKLCARLGRTASAANARPERRAGLAELLTILSSGRTDARPLRRFYQSVVPGSYDEVVQSWKAAEAVSWTSAQESCLLLGHRELAEQQFLQDLFPAKPKESTGFGQNEALFRGNLPFCETILNRLISLEGDQVNIPDDFMDEFAMPLLNKFAKRRHTSTVEMNKFLGLIVLCVKTHPQGFQHLIALRGNDSNVLFFTMQRFVDVKSPEERKHLESHLQSLLPLLPSTCLTMPDVYAGLSLQRSHHPRYAEVRYDLLKLIFENGECFRLDLESEAQGSLQRLKDASLSWPAELFMLLPIAKALALLDKLERVHKGESFIVHTGRETTVLQQERFETNKTDVDIVRTILQRKQDPSGNTWLSGVRLLVKDRKKKATETREPRQRAFWAKSAINLCVAAGELSLLHDTFSWAQRFIKDPMVGPEVHGRGIMTRELNALLTAVPIPIDFETIERLEESISTARHDAGPSSKVMITLIHNAISAVREPGFKAANWADILRLPGKIAKERIRAVGSIRRLAAEIGASDPQSIVAEIIWKPTISLLLQAEALMADPSASKLSGRRSYAALSAGAYMQDLPPMDPPLRADMTTFFIEAMRSQLPPTLFNSQIGLVVRAVSKLAHSSQPALAIPFINPIIQNSEDSSNHRQLLTSSFLQSLPAQGAREFLRSVAAAMTDTMKAQNSRSWTESKSEKQPGIKVTTVKMMADLLNDNLVVDANTSCDILVSLLKEARHIDARIAIITSLLSTLEESTSTPVLRKNILDVFEELILPMASQLNERQPTTEEEWQAEGLPEVSEQSSILTLLVAKAQAKTLRNEDHVRLVHIIMGALEQSATMNQRWVRVFAEKYGYELSQEDNLSVGPAHIAPLRTMFRREFDSVPDTLVHMLQNMALQNADPSPTITHINESVKADASLRESNAGKHWLSQFDNPGDPGVFLLGFEASLGLIQIGAESPHGQSRIGQLRQFVTSVVERWTRRGLPELVYISVSRLASGSIIRGDKAPDWRANSALVMEDFIRVAEAVHNRGSIAPMLLPNTFRIRLGILRMKHWGHDENITDAQVTGFASMIFSLVERLANRRGAYHNDFALLKQEVSRVALSDPAHSRSAVALAQPEEDLQDADPSLATCLRFELIAESLKAAQVPKDKDVKGEVRRLVENWVTCPSEELKAMGQRLEADLKKQKGWYTTESDVVMLDA